MTPRMPHLMRLFWSFAEAALPKSAPSWKQIHEFYTVARKDSDMAYFKGSQSHDGGNGREVPRRVSQGEVGEPEGTAVFEIRPTGISHTLERKEETNKEGSLDGGQS